MIRTVSKTAAGLCLGLALCVAPAARAQTLATPSAAGLSDRVLDAGAPILTSLTIAAVSASLTAAPIARSIAATGKGGAQDDTDDPIDDRGLLEMIGASVGDVLDYCSYVFGSFFDTITPPTPTSMVMKLRDDDQQAMFFTLLGYAGYKIKEIENGIGLPPDITIKFGRIRDLSSADEDFINRELARWARKDTGILASAQRAIIDTVININEDSAYKVDSLRVRMLPLPQVKFSLGPAEGGLTLEGSTLMRAIQRLDLRMAELQKK
jgi:hypothetical protein